MKGGNLVVVLVGSDAALGRIEFRNLKDMFVADAKRYQPLTVV